ncbi:MAG: radical SAM protein [Oligoflexia bacterium]|nr:radical SAM protein [Oligoflexia bacterium]
MGFGQRLMNKGLLSAARVISMLPDQVVVNLSKNQLDKTVKFQDGREFIMSFMLTLKHRWNKLNPNVRRKLTENMVGNYFINARKKRYRIEEELGCSPLLFVISPTMRCNLKCTGCYSANYNRSDSLDYNTLDRIMKEAKELGIYYVVVSGGEPFVRDDLMTLFEKHNDMVFMVYTNSTLIHTKKLAPRLARLGNVVPCISVEGYKNETDGRRGEGTYENILGAMKALKEEGVFFGYSATPTKYNNQLLVEDSFVDFWIRQGASIGWYFNYMPIGREPDTDLMNTPEQRAYRWKRINELRKTKDIVLADFWNDGTLTGGCIAGARSYFHINASGDVEPCVFAQFSVDNVMHKPLRDIIVSDFFRSIRSRQGEMSNRLRPCMIIDRPQVLRDHVERFNAKPSQPGGEKLLAGELAAKVDRIASDWKEVADRIWVEQYGGLPEVDTEHHVGKNHLIFEDKYKRDSYLMTEDTEVVQM